MSSYPVVLTDKFCIIIFSCPPTSATFDSAPAPEPMYEGWQGLLYQRTCPKSRFSQDTLTEYAGYRMDGIALFRTVCIDHSFCRPASPDSSSYGNTISVQPNFDSLHVWDKIRPPPHDVQNGRPCRS